MVASARHDIVELPKLHENGLKIIIIIPLFEKCKCKKPSETHFALTPPWECKWCVCVCVCVCGGGGGGTTFNTLHVHVLTLHVMISS